MTYNSSFNNHFKTGVGHLDIEAPQTSGGKKLFEWTFKAATVKNAENNFKSFNDEKVTVHMFVTDGTISFQAKSKLFTERMEDTDINALKKRVKDFFLMQITALNGGIVWEDWLEVIVKGETSDFSDSSFSALGGNLHIQVNRLKRGVDPSTGAPLTISANGTVTEFPKPTSITDPDDGLVSFLDPSLKDIPASDWSKVRFKGKPEERSYIPATPENMQALESILIRLAELRHNLADLLSQDSITEKLTEIKWLAIEHKQENQ